MLTVYGIPNCDTVKKSLDWLKKHKVSSSFHDYKKQGITKKELDAWSKQVGIEVLLNKKSTTWRGLTPEQQATTATKAGAIALMAANTSLIKRPVIVKDGVVVAVGFDEANYAQKIKG